MQVPFSLQVPFSPDRPLGTPKLCKNCVHFRKPPAQQPLTSGLCTRFGMMNLIDGEMGYSVVTTVRENMCRNAQYYEEKAAVATEIPPCAQ